MDAKKTTFSPFWGPSMDEIYALNLHIFSKHIFGDWDFHELTTPNVTSGLTPTASARAST